MALIQYRQKQPKGMRRRLVDICNGIIAEYQAAGYRMTLRQLYYQLVSRDMIPNDPAAYKRLGELVVDARYAGLIDWQAIEDRVRVPSAPPEFDGLGQLVDAALSSYRLPRWDGQGVYAELWVEKDALAGVLQPLARRFHIPLMVNRGYGSATALFEAAGRFQEKEVDGDRTFLFYLGDHDPSGLDMVRDLDARLNEFGAGPAVRHIALTTAQVREYRPPPNPAKITDSRAEAYIAEHGRESWEVDALPPTVLGEVVTAALKPIIDQDLLEVILAQEKEDKERLRKAVEGLEAGP